MKPTTVNTVKFLPINISSLFLVQLLPICKSGPLYIPLLVSLNKFPLIREDYLALPS